MIAVKNFESESPNSSNAKLRYLDISMVLRRSLPLSDLLSLPYQYKERHQQDEVDRCQCCKRSIETSTQAKWQGIESDIERKNFNRSEKP
jgi:hypothetical protein